MKDEIKAIKDAARTLASISSLRIALVTNSKLVK